jgi:hypothetical protein
MWLIRNWADGKPEQTPEALEAAARRAEESGARSDATDLRHLTAMLLRQQARGAEEHADELEEYLHRRQDGQGD